MKKLVHSKEENCIGCNKCIRVCPVEVANQTYLQADGTMKVRINHEMCIACGACIDACKHDSRVYMDDVDKFFQDLDKGVSISLIAAPAIRANIPEWMNLFTYLKGRGVRKIYDVSLGADICIWGHLRYIQRYKPKSVITQPCPVIVDYCMKYQTSLLKDLSPVQSPMACTAIYMKKYEHIQDAIAALSPCIAKTKEFESIGIIRYNITFKKLIDYMKEKRIVLPQKETGFDHYDSGMGTIFSMPGGLKENMEYFMGKAIRVDKAEGEHVYDALNTYGNTPMEFRPHVFDVLNCGEGCNQGTGCHHQSSVFEINTLMDHQRKKADKVGVDFFEEQFCKYDRQFDLHDFLRSYKPIAVKCFEIDKKDIESAFHAMSKDTFEKQNVDCSACGSDSCLEMARKIAMGVNVPESCMVKSREDALEARNKSVSVLNQMETYTSTIEQYFQQIKEISRNIHTEAEDLNEVIEGYNKMVFSIDRIANMINIISINATIEAARAGQQGKAFSVIADEIRMLTGKTKNTVMVAEQLSAQSEIVVTKINHGVEEIQNIVQMESK